MIKKKRGGEKEKKKRKMKGNTPNFSSSESTLVHVSHEMSLFHTGMSMGLGGNPYGPAGTGKTESVKALGGLFGRQVLVFNCDEVTLNDIALLFIQMSIN